MTQLEQIAREIMIFMRGHYRLDEISDGRGEFKFRQGKKTILTLYPKEDRITFLLIFGRKEREAFDAARSEFPEWITSFYDGAKTYHDGKWMFIDVTSADQLAPIQQMILIKKKPNRKPFPKENAVRSRCGHRCDLCVHFSPMPEEQRAMVRAHLRAVWHTDDWDMRCGGCNSPDCHRKNSPCEVQACAAEKGYSACRECSQYPCSETGAASCKAYIHSDAYSVDDVTWGILPYVPDQYGN